ncbi:hypothetical protein GCM10010431_16860 [Streptomyces kunmingensis]
MGGAFRGPPFDLLVRAEAVGVALLMMLVTELCSLAHGQRVTSLPANKPAVRVNTSPLRTGPRERGGAGFPLRARGGR